MALIRRITETTAFAIIAWLIVIWLLLNLVAAFQASVIANRESDNDCTVRSRWHYVFPGTNAGCDFVRWMNQHRITEGNGEG